MYDAGFNVSQAICTGDDLKNISDDELKKFDGVLFSRVVSTKLKTKEITDRCKSLGLKVFFDIDDYWLLPSWHGMKKNWEDNKLLSASLQGINQSDVVITTTPSLWEKIYQYNKNVYVVPNSFYEKEKQFTKREIKNKRLRVGWVGGVYHLNDFKMIEGEFKKMWADKELIDKIQLCLGGYTEGQKEYLSIEKIMTNNYSGLDYEYISFLKKDTRMFEHVSFDKPYRRLYGRDVNEYMDIYNDLDICIAPLGDGVFNNSKSQLKAIEAGVMGKAFIGSNVYPYTIDCNKGNSILVNNNEWYQAIRELVFNEEKRKYLAENLNLQIKEKYNSEKINEQRKKIYWNRNNHLQ